MIVAYNALSVRPGVVDGAATYSLNVLRHLPEALREARVVVYARADERRIPEHPRLDVRRLRVRNARSRIRVEALGLARELRAAGADVLVSPNESVPLAPPCPVVVVAQNLVYHRDDGAEPAFRGERARDRLASRIQAAYYRARMRRAYARAAAVIAVSSETARVLERRAGLDRTKAVIVHEGSDSFLLPEPSPSPSPGPRLLVVSALSPYKNHTRAIDALAMLRERHPELTLEVVGGDWRGYRRVLERHADARSVGDAVRFRGQVDGGELASLYERSLVLLHLSACESFGLPVLEAMRYGLPVVAANRSSLPEVAGNAAELVDPDDPVAVADAVARLVRDPARRAQLAARGRERAAELTWRRAADAVAAVVTRALAAQRSATT